VKTPTNYVSDLIMYLGYVISFTADGREIWSQNEMAILAVERAFHVIGEIAKRLPEDFKNAHDEIDWRSLIRFRDYIAHNYEDVKLDRFWAAVEDAPRLKSALERLLNSLPPDPPTP
jgi:uncharacterized protein with HEPN domain